MNMETQKKATVAGMLILIGLSAGFISYRLHPEKINDYEVKQYHRKISLCFYRDGEEQKFLSFYTIWRPPYANGSLHLYVLDNHGHPAGVLVYLVKSWKWYLE